MSVSTPTSAHVALVGADTAQTFVACAPPKPEKPLPVLPIEEMVGEVLALGFKVVRIKCRRLYNVLSGKENPPAREDIRDFINSYVKSATIAALKVKQHGEILAERVRAKEIVGVVHMAIEAVRVSSKLVTTGTLRAAEAVHALARCTASTVGDLAGAAKGAAIGAIGGPIGDLAGGVVGGIAGSKIAKTIAKAAKIFVRTAAKILKNIIQDKSGQRRLNPLNWFAR